MEEQQRLTASRRAHKAHLTKLLRKIGELKQAEDDQNEQRDIPILGSYLDQLKRKGQVISELDNKIFALITEPEELETDIIEAEDTQTLIAETICTTASFIERKTEFMNTNQQDRATGASNNVQETPPSNQATGNVSEQTGNQPSTSQGTQSESNTVSEVLPVDLNQPVNTSTPITSTNTNANSSYSVSRLPKLALPTFNGDPLNW